jgi:hypothetical protein
MVVGERPICYPSRAVGLILDLAVVILGLLVIGSLAILAWTLAFSAVRAIRLERERVADARRSVAAAEARVRSDATRLAAIIADLATRTADVGDRNRS